MDFKVRNIQNNKNNLTFQGLKGEINAKNEKTFKFYAPPHKSSEDVYLEFAPLALDQDLDEYVWPKESLLSRKGYKFDPISGVFEVKQDKISSGAFAYRYKVVDRKTGATRYELDNAKKIPIDGTQNQANFIEIGKNYGATPKMGSMYHMFYDSVTLDDKLNLMQNPPRTHFNTFGGSLANVLKMLKAGDLDQYEYIMTNPDIGADSLSSHKYWPTNLYQSNDIQAFDDLNFELFKKGMGYVADGAFTSQGLQSPLFQHVLTHFNSPFRSWFRMDPTHDIEIGMFPDKQVDNPDVYKNLGVKITNSPYQDGYDKNQPTYYQLYDKRLVSDGVLKDTQHTIGAYDKAPSDIYEIAYNDDSVYQVKFQLDPTNPADLEKLKFFGKSSHKLCSEIDKEYKGNFFRFQNYSLTDRATAANATFWAGNRDMIKFNTDNPEVKNYLWGIATYWTERTKSNLLLKTAQMSDKTRAEVAEKNGVSYETVKNPPQGTTYPVLEQNKQVEDYVKNFPLQSIQTDPELSAVFAEAKFNQELFDSSTLERVTSAVKDVIKTAIPSEYQGNEEYIAYVTKVYAMEIISNMMIKAMKPDAVGLDGEVDLAKLKQVNLRTLGANDRNAEIERKNVVRKIQNGLRKPDVQIANRMREELKNVTLEDFKQADSIITQGKAGLNWRFDAARDIGDLDSVEAYTKEAKQVYSDIARFWTQFIANIKKDNPSALIINELTNTWDYYNKNEYTEKDIFDPTIAKANKALYGNNVPSYREAPIVLPQKMLARSGATTNSNYEKAFNHISLLFGISPESKGDVGKDNGKVKALKENIQDNFIAINQPNVAMLSHTFVENHDKPRVAHCIPLDCSLFLSDSVDKANYSLAKKITGRTDYDRINPKALAVADMMYNTIEDVYGNDDKAKKLKEVLRNLANGATEAEPDKYNYNRALAFGKTAYEISVPDMFKRAGITDENEVLDFLSTMMEKATKAQTMLWKVMCAIPGLPTMFNGMEFMQTGYETETANQYGGNRGKILTALKTDPRYNAYYNEMTATTALPQKAGLSALKDGFSESLEIISTEKSLDFKDVDKGNLEYQLMALARKDKNVIKEIEELISSGEIHKKTPKEWENIYGIWFDDTNIANFKKYNETRLTEGEYKGKTILEAALDIYKYNNEIADTMWPIFRYDNKGSKVIQLITNNGIKGDKTANNRDFETKKIFTKGINLKSETSETSPLADGTILGRYKYTTKTTANAHGGGAINKKGDYCDTGETFIVSDGKIKPAKKVDSKWVADESKSVELTDIVETFYVK